MKNNNYYFIRPYDESLPKPPQESFGQILNEVYLQPFNWKGRTTRKSFWISFLINAIISIIASILLGYALNSDLNLGLKWIDGVIAILVFVWIFLAGLGQRIRRLHDVGYSGYWYWAAFTGYGAMFLFYLDLQPSVQRKVKWGKYLFSEQDYPEGHEEKVPVPTIGQILKEHFFDCFKWNARSTRTSYWVGTATYQVVGTFSYLLIYTLSAFIGLAPQELKHESSYAVLGIFFICTLLFLAIISIWVFLAQLGHAVRRLHDAGFSGWWWWLNIIPSIGNLLLAFLLFHPTVKEDVKWNKYLFEEKDRIR
ncbi:DUF805 domain-containing protein [Lactobacillus sp. HT06-2]|uniref:DUF805 domain-containing protein n=1 Tax=Lactobacillus sp. HT06-2 TaxID=2080222 RepID=UPI000CD802D1|nr:DUF805 domain-containing protein [Lactobacillus sp. HT06-2]